MEGREVWREWTPDILRRQERRRRGMFPVAAESAQSGTWAQLRIAFRSQALKGRHCGYPRKRSGEVNRNRRIHGDGGRHGHKDEEEFNDKIRLVATRNTHLQDRQKTEMQRVEASTIPA